MSHRPVPSELLQMLTEHAQLAGALMLPVTGAAMRARLTAALSEGAKRQEHSPGYATELELWTRR